MCSIIAILLLLVGGFLGFSAVEQTSIPPATPQISVATAEAAPTLESPVATAEAAPLPTQAISCATQDSAQDLAEMTQVIDAKIFEPALWTARSDVNDQRTTTTWHSDKFGAVAYLEYLHFDCGVSQEQIDQYFTPETFQTIMSSYSSYVQTAHCELNGLRLFEFDASFNDTQYHILYWVKQVTPTRVADFTLTFPINSAVQAGAVCRTPVPEFADLSGGIGMIYEYEGVTSAISLQPLGEHRYRATIGDRELVVTAVPFEGGWLIDLDGKRVRVYAASRDRERWIQAEGETYPLSVATRQRTPGVRNADLTAQMPGQVREIFVQAGETVTAGQTLLVLEAMKMEIRLSAPADGRVKRLLVNAGDVVDRGQRLVEME